MTLHFLNDVANDAESTLKINHYIIFASFNLVSQLGKLINRIPDLRLLISSLSDSALKTHVESLDKPRDVNKRSRSLTW